MTGRGVLLCAGSFLGALAVTATLGALALSAMYGVSFWTALSVMHP